MKRLLCNFFGHPKNAPVIPEIYDDDTYFIGKVDCVRCHSTYCFIIQLHPEDSVMQDTLLTVASHKKPDKKRTFRFDEQDCGPAILDYVLKDAMEIELSKANKSKADECRSLLRSGHWRLVGGSYVNRKPAVK